MRLWQRLFLAFAVLSGTSLFVFAAWQQHTFRSSFLGYLDEVSLQRVAPAAARLEAAYTEHGNWDFLRDDPPRFVQLIEPGRGRGEPPPPERPPLSVDVRDPPPFDPGRPPPERGPPRGPPDLMPRLLLLDAQGERVVGNPRVPADAASIPIMAGDARIGTLRMAPLPQLSGATDLAFAQTQTRSALYAGAIVLVGALLLALALARWLLAPVEALTRGTRSLSAGDYATRIGSARGDELGALARDFDRLAATLEEHQRARRQWGADIAHELRTPLSILRGEVQALQDGVRTYSPAALESLATECDRLGRLIEDLYQLTLADAGGLEYRFEPVDLAELLDECSEAHRRVCAEAGLSLEQQIGRIPPVRGDARRIAQLVDNLLVNARRYTDSPGRIRIVLESAGNMSRISIDDTAPGVPAAALPRLFERLYRVDASRSRAAGGAGLGLAICRAIAAAHGGRIDAQQSAMGGLRVVVELPFAETR